MNKILKDPLLDIARALLLFLMGLMAIGVAACLIGLPLIVFNRDRVLLAIAEETARMPSSETAWAIAGLLVLVIAVLSLLFLFLRHMKRIVDSVAIGDPFIAENATRLTAMAWLMLSVQIIAIPIAAVAIYIAETVGEGTGTVDSTFDVNGIVLVMTLFILARVFRHGAAMREDLEGTV
jgi:hypothetical protein